MKDSKRGILQIIFLVVFVLVLLRIFPWIMRFVERAGMGIREFWWVILALILAGWLVWVLKKRNSG